MDTITRLYDLEITIDPAEVARLLGYGREEIPDRVQAILDEIVGKRPDLVEARCAYRRLKRHSLAHSPYLYHVDDVVLCLVTIGPGVEQALEEEKRNGRLGRALVLDMFGSAAAEAAAEAANAAIANDYLGKGLHCSHRFSPGYACWDVKEQQWILPTLEGEEIGVSLTEGSMMSPRKSVTFAVTVAETPVESRHEHSCNSCGMIDCLYKLTD